MKFFFGFSHSWFLNSGFYKESLRAFVICCLAFLPTVVSASPQSADTYKIEMLERAISEAGDGNLKENDFDLAFPEVSRVAGKLGEQEILEHWLENSSYPENDPRLLQATAEAAKAAAFYGHFQLSQSLFDGVIDSRSEINLWMELATFCGVVGANADSLLQKLMAAKLVEFAQEESGGFGGPTVFRIEASDLPMLKSEFQMAYTFGLIKAGRVKQAIVAAEEISDVGLREVTQVGILKIQAREIGFPADQEFSNVACQKAAYAARLQWLENHSTFSELVDSLLQIEASDVRRSTAGDRLVKIIVQQAAGESALTELTAEQREGVVKMLVAMFDEVIAEDQADDDFDPVDQVTCNTSANCTWRNVDEILGEDGGDKLTVKNICSALVAIVSPAEYLKFTERLPSRRAVVEWLELVVERRIAEQQWDAAEETFGKLVRIQWEITRDRLSEKGEVAGPFDPSSKFAKDKADDLFYSIVLAAARRGQFDVSSRFISRINSSLIVDKSKLNMTAWQNEKADSSAIVARFPIFEDVFRAELEALPQSERLKYIVNKVMEIGWKIDQGITSLPMAEMFETAILELDQPGKALSQMRLYRRSFTPPGPAARAFLESMILKLQPMVEAKLDANEEDATDPALDLKLILENFDALVEEFEKEGRTYESKDAYFRSRSDQILRLVKSIPDERRSRLRLESIGQGFARDGDHGSVERLLALLDSSSRIEVCLAVAETFPPLPTPLSPHFESVRESGGVF